MSEFFRKVWFVRNVTVFGLMNDSLVNGSCHDSDTLHPLQIWYISIFDLNSMIDWRCLDWNSMNSFRNKSVQVVFLNVRHLRSSSDNFSLNSLCAGIVLVACLNIRIDWANHWRFKGFFVILRIENVVGINIVSGSSQRFLRPWFFLSLREVLALSINSSINGSLKALLSLFSF